MSLRPFRMSGSGWETLPDVKSGRAALPDVQECSEGHSRCQGVVERPSRMFVSGWEALLDVREWLGGPPRCP